ncbi:hypothetical protein QBC34DRAFT_484735 [Podospora aff. communis PSN243]|uniref:Uncharacterized protein n=1 Tax=Podospora aff. communis PSN243 TaxID=3040156 RepID=A0AAV9GLU7_9PEZI|nr:hypothetical protein QBC34DRAFT_484735 [Podospora aff. communis PSN243]
MATLQRQDTLSNSPLLRRTPWPGIAAIAGMATCLVASAVVIAVSHDDLVASWRVQPAVLLSIFSASSNIVFNTALATGIAVRFWLCAERGVKLSHLHYIWDHGRVFGIGSAVRAGPPARTVAVFALLANVMQFVGAPLLQRSSYQVLQYHQSNESISIDLAREIPDGWFGSKDKGRMTEFNRAYPLIQQWWHNSSISTRHQDEYGCEGSCDGFVAGAGFAYNCWKTSQSLELATNKTDNQTVFLVRLSNVKNQTGNPFLRLTTWYTADITDACVGTVHKEVCDIDAATVSYPVTIQNHTVRLRREELTGPSGGPAVLSRYTVPGDDHKVLEASGIGPLMAMQSFAQARITDNATKTYLWDKDVSYYSGPGLVGDIFHVVDGGDEVGPRARCRLTFRSPTEYVLETLYDFMFRAAMVVGNGTQTQVIEARRTVPTLLERPVTLSPLETASAMGAPIFPEGERGATINEILAKVRNIEFRIGSPHVETSTTTAEISK